MCWVPNVGDTSQTYGTVIETHLRNSSKDCPLVRYIYNAMSVYNEAIIACFAHTAWRGMCNYL